MASLMRHVGKNPEPCEPPTHDRLQMMEHWNRGVTAPACRGGGGEPGGAGRGDVAGGAESVGHGGEEDAGRQGGAAGAQIRGGGQHAGGHPPAHGELQPPWRCTPSGVVHLRGSSFWGRKGKGGGSIFWWDKLFKGKLMLQRACPCEWQASLQFSNG